MFSIDTSQIDKHREIYKYVRVLIPWALYNLCMFTNVPIKILAHSTVDGLKNGLFFDYKA